MKRCVKSQFLETRNGYTLNREEDREIDPLTMEPKGRTYVFYTVNDDELMLESFKTLRQARKYADEQPEARRIEQ